MAMFLLFRSSDHLVLGVDWVGMTVAAGDPPVLTAGDGARIVLTFPPQHIGEEFSGEGDPAPHQLRSTSGTVPGWKGILSGPSAIAIGLPRGATVTLTIEGVLTAAGTHPVAVDGTSIEMPWGLSITPSTGPQIACAHRAAPPTSGRSASSWRTRVAPRGDPDGELSLRAIGSAPDPPIRIPLDASARVRIVAQTEVSPATATRLELSTLGGTLDVTGRWPEFEWDHHCVLGRDTSVRTLASGMLYPFGHRANVLEVTIRIFDDAAGHVADLRRQTVLTVTEPVRHAPATGAVRRGFPFDSVTFDNLVYRGLETADWTDFTFADGRTLPTYFWPRQAHDGALVQFPVTADNAASGAVRFEVPLVFVNDLSSLHIDTESDVGLAGELARVYGTTTVELPATQLELTERRHADGVDGTVHEVHALLVAGVPTPTDGFRPALAGMSVRLPALRTLLDEAETATHLVRYAARYLHDPAADVLLEVAQPIDVDFVKKADRVGALAAPRYVADAISRTFGPVNLGALPNPANELFDAARLLGEDAKILGYSMRSLLGNAAKAPKIVTDLTPGRAPRVSMQWKAVALKASGGFVAAPGATMDLVVEAGPDLHSTTCTVRTFGLQFPPSKPMLRIMFETLGYLQENGQPPRLDVGHVDVAFLGDLKFVEELKNAVDLGKASKFIDVTSTSISVHYEYAAPPIPFGAFSIRNIAMATRLTVPYDGAGVVLTLGLSSRAKPFQLSVLTFGGSGYAELELDPGGIRRLEAALEFGAMMAVDFVVAKGEVHVLGGVRFTLLADGSVTVSGYLRMGGSVDVLGLISVSIELVLELSYDSKTNALVGRATLVIEIDLTLWSDGIELDTGNWVLAGGNHGAAPHHAMPASDALYLAGAQEVADPGFEAWQVYRRAYTGVVPS